MDGCRFFGDRLMLVVVWLHLLSVVTWMGGLLFASHLVAPRLGRAGTAERDALADLLRRFRLVTWMAIALLILTGLVNLSRLPFSAALLFERAVGLLLSLKLLLTIVAFALQAQRDFAILPRLLSASPQETGHSFGLRWLDRIVLLLLLVILYLGVSVSRAVH